jgi:hypothetical protein
VSSYSVRLCAELELGIWGRKENPLVFHPGATPEIRRVDFVSIPGYYCTVTALGAEGIPFVTTTRVLAPVSVADATVKCVDSDRVPV